MKIAILTSGILPVPAVRGGAVENLTDFYLEYNERHRLHDITVYSVHDPAVGRHPALHAEANHYIYIKADSPWAKVRKRLLHWLHRRREYYHYTVEYYLHEALSHIRHQHYDLIILENRPGYALQLAGLTEAPLVYHLHNEKLTPHVAHAQAIYGAATRILCVSDYIRSQVQAISPGDTKTHTVYNGIDLSAFRPDEATQMERSTLHLTVDDFVLVFSGRVTQEKGIMELIEAMLLLSGHQRIKLLVIGSSFYGNADNENDFARQLKAKAEPLKERILFTGFIPYSQMPGYLRMADAAVIPSVWDDPFPTTVIEAQAMGLPVIATRRGGIPEEVTTETAILLDTDQQFVQHLADAILDLYQHPNKRRQMGEAAVQHSRQFSKERYAEDFFSALATI